VIDLLYGSLQPQTEYYVVTTEQLTAFVEKSGMLRVDEISIFVELAISS